MTPLITHRCRECDFTFETEVVDGDEFIYTCKACLPKDMAADHEPMPDAPPEPMPAIPDLIVADIQARDQVGQERYGTRLYPHNGRRSLVDLYQELLDACMYIRQTIYEQEGK